MAWYQGESNRKEQKKEEYPLGQPRQRARKSMGSIATNDAEKSNKTKLRRKKLSKSNLTTNRRVSGFYYTWLGNGKGRRPK